MKVHIGNYKKNGERKINVQIDEFDTWNVDSTLAIIIAPLLKKFKEVKNGAAFVENSDVPVELHGNTEDPLYADTDPRWFDRWNYVLDEMIFAFESYQTDWEDQFWLSDRFDREGYTVYQARINNGFRLFGKYYGNLWS